MSETISMRKLNNLKDSLPVDRENFYITQRARIDSGQDADSAVDIVTLLLFSTDGELVLQKRSHTKAHNPFMIDKAIGGHIKYGDTAQYTLMVETVQELRVPSIVLRSYSDFVKTYDLLHTYLDHIAVVKELDTSMFILDRVIDGKIYPIPNHTSVYIGVYGGATKPVDKEASGVLYYDYNVLREEIQRNPNNFTYNLKFLIDKYRFEIENFRRFITK